MALTNLEIVQLRESVTRPKLERTGLAYDVALVMVREGLRRSSGKRT